VFHTACPSRRCGGAALVALSAVLVGCSLPGPAARDSTVAEYDPASGRLQRLAFDTTRDGRNDAVGIMDGARVQRIEADEDEDGKIDRWEFYDANGHLEKAGFSRQGNGIMDALAFYGADGDVQRVEMSTRGDGHFNRVEYYESESLVRVEEDTSGDGRVDKWETYTVDSRRGPGRSPSIATAAFDDYARGVPSRRLVYRPDGSVLRVEIDQDGDGIFAEPTTAGPRK